MTARRIFFSALFFLAVLFSFAAGMWTTYKDWKPWQLTTDVQKLWRSWRATGQFLRDGTYQPRADYSADMVYVAKRPERAAKGYWVINRFDPVTQTFVTDLIDQEGITVHSRPIDYSLLVPDGNPTEFAHITTMLPDGSLMVNFGNGRSMARLDACGKPIWNKNDQVYHHSIEKADDGYWTWAEPLWSGGQNQEMVRFDPETGETMETMHLIDDVILESSQNALALTIPEGFKFTRDAREGETKDILHPNDVEALSAAMAPAFPQFRAGDLLISLRNINLVAVIDRRTHRVLWAQHGPWLDQHDPDFQPDGTITVFSNNIDRNRSTIIQVDPKTGVARDLFEGTETNFNSFIMGKHQHLPNGNWMITSPIEGRVLEVTAAGEMVREWSNILDGRYNAIVSYSEFLPDGYLERLPNCQE
ncbi:hypothetical protein OU426_15130 [Frigidibacter sp. RF13]|uniref:arylsulfotransferase family protein n=1 Tax=Frigidibacter sp. RF13 TaxID=2997340 RepID=UPI00226EFDFF|nr:arylsulfotransferase family protein [Frigidibacter sp. RF13]MCY1128196.1 hypothetical protein [Frigidibacter sp. RF13]